MANKDCRRANILEAASLNVLIRAAREQVVSHVKLKGLATSICFTGRGHAVALQPTTSQITRVRDYLRRGRCRRPRGKQLGKRAGQSCVAELGLLRVGTQNRSTDDDCLAGRVSVDSLAHEEGSEWD